MTNPLVLFSLFTVALSAANCPTSGVHCKKDKLIGCKVSGAADSSCATVAKCTDEPVNAPCGHNTDTSLQGKCLTDKTCVHDDAARSIHVTYSLKVADSIKGEVQTTLKSSEFLRKFATGVASPVISNVVTCPTTLTTTGDMGVINKVEDSIVFTLSLGKLTCTDRLSSNPNSAACTLTCPTDHVVGTASSLTCNAAHEWAGSNGTCVPAVFASVQITAKDSGDQTALLGDSKPSGFEDGFKGFINTKVSEVGSLNDVAIVGYKKLASLKVQVDYTAKVSTTAVLATAKPKLIAFNKAEFATTLDNRQVDVLVSACPKYDAPVDKTNNSGGNLACSDNFVNSAPCTRLCGKVGYGVKTASTRKCEANGTAGEWNSTPTIGVCAKECSKTDGRAKPPQTTFNPMEHGITFVVNKDQEVEGKLTCPDRFVGVETDSRKCALTCTNSEYEPDTPSGRYCGDQGGDAAWIGADGACVKQTNVAGSARLVLLPSEDPDGIAGGENTTFNDKFKKAVADEIAGAEPADVTIVSIRKVPGRRLNERAVQVDYTIRVLNQGRRA